MSFNWKDFATGFLQQTNITMDEKAAEAKAKKSKQEELARRNAPLVEQRRARARQASTLGLQAKKLGATDEQLAVALNSGVAGIQDFYKKLQAAANEREVKTLSQYDIEAIIDMPDIPSINMSYEDMVNQVYGAKPSAVPSEGSAPPLWASMLGLTAVQDVEQDLATDQFASGMTVQQINDMAASSEYSQIPGMEGAMVNYGDDKYFDSDKALTLTTNLTKVINDVKKSDGYITLGKRLNLGVENGTVEKADMEQELGQYIKDAANLDSTMLAYGDSYKSSFFDNRVMKAFFKANGLESIAATYAETYNRPVPKDGVVKTVTSTGEVIEEPVVAEDASVADVKVTELKTEPARLPYDADEKALAEESLRGFSIFSEADEKYTDMHTREEWEDMSKKERKDLNLPVSKLGGMNFYFRDEVDDLIGNASENIRTKRKLGKLAYKLKIKGKLKTYHITAEQLAKLDDAFFAGMSPLATLVEYEDEEESAKKVTSSVLKSLTAKGGK
jgi:hypothetical protein